MNFTALFRILLLVLVAGSEWTPASGQVWTHAASGIGFPMEIESRFTRTRIETNGNVLKVIYRFPTGHPVTVTVWPAPPTACGPTQRDGDRTSAATPAFQQAFEQLKSIDRSGRVVSESRFQVALHKQGPIGLKATVKGHAANHEVLLVERNGYFVSFTMDYAEADWLRYTRTYPDVANFLHWPAPRKPAGVKRAGANPATLDRFEGQNR
jgi:hypothetical protein